MLSKLYAKYYLIVIFLFYFSQSLSCTNFSVSTKNNVIVARTLDFESNLGNQFALGYQGDLNSSNLNLNKKAPVFYWKNKYAFLGQTGMHNPIIIDGINSRGVYAGYFYLPGITKYPKLNSQLKKPALGIFDVVNYILGVASSVKDADKLLSRVQIVNNAVSLDPTHSNSPFAIMPMQILIRDKSGASMVIEFINKKAIFFRHPGHVLTNAPSLSWQLRNARKYDYVKTNLSHLKYDGQLMSGSGFVGIPGDWTPPGRFVRMTQVIRHFPKCQSDAQALYLARQGLGIVTVNLGVNPSPTLWVSISNLKKGVYYFRPLLNVVNAKKHIYSPMRDDINSWREYNLKKVVAQGQIPKGWLRARISQAKKVTSYVNMMVINRDFTENVTPSFSPKKK